MKTILVVDDDPMVLESTRCYLDMKGFRTVCASDGDEALELSKHTQIDLALIDIFMPKRGGFETIMEINGTFPVIAMSGVTSHRFDPLAFAESIGARNALSKPFRPDDMLTAINDILENRPH
ncbi:response regulator [Terasakiella sp. SH-1]|uniref:response regulator n=1 Tax=Terasakiella sp. SH-1 TaxID=2560057 RepID=UPI001073276D|nr:response regulator [Terasakiella sp. SH-1]